MNKKGFTLIEVIAAIVVVGLGLVSVLEAFSMGHKIMRLRQDRVVVAQLLQSMMEQAKTGDIPFSGTCGTLPTCAEMCTPLKDCNYTVTKSVYNSLLLVTKIDATVTWLPVGWGPQTETIMTLVTIH